MLTAETIAKALGGHKSGQGWMARCPAHDDRRPSLAIRDDRGGRTLVRCHAGCQQADVIAALRSRGLWPGERASLRPGRTTDPTGVEPKAAARRTEFALALWHAARHARGTLVEWYLASRAIDIPAPSALRFHPGLKHPSGGIWPAILALVMDVDDRPIGIHRTFLVRDGSGKAPVVPEKMSLGRVGGGAVRLGALAARLTVAEGIETALSAMQVTGLPAWAALSTSGLRALALPAAVRDVIVLADGDDPGEAAALDCAWRWKREGRRVRIARPPRGQDFNEMLIGGASHVAEDA